MLDSEKKTSSILKTENLWVKRAHIDSWTMFLLLSKLEGEKQADLAEWGMIDELCEYLLDEMVSLIGIVPLTFYDVDKRSKRKLHT